MASNGAGFTESLVHAPVSNYGAYKYRSKMGMMNSAEFTVLFDDLVRPIATNVPEDWSAAIIDIGATLTASTTAGSPGNTGAAVIASDGASEGVAVYMPKAIQLTSGKKFFMEMRCRTNNAAEVDLQFGLSDLTATTNPEDLWTTVAANLVAFGLLAGSAYPKMLSDKANSGTSVQAQTLKALSNDTDYILAIGYDGTTLSAYINGVEVITWSGAAATIPTGVALAPFFGGRTGATASNTSTVDYVRFVIER